MNVGLMVATATERYPRELGERSSREFITGDFLSV